MGFLKKIVSNKILQYIFSRYATYFIQFINSLFIAVYLGPFYLGVWGFITLIIQYFSQINLGIPHSVNAIVAINKKDEDYVVKTTGTSLVMMGALSIVIILLFIANSLFFNIGEKYNFSVYAPVIALIAILNYFNSIISNIFRIYGKLFEIAFNQSVFPVLILLVVFFFKGENLLWALVLANCVSSFISFLLFIIRSPVKLRPSFNFKLTKIIQKKGWHLFIYNASFYLIIISTKSFISDYYSVSEFGYFTFAFSLANAIFLLLQSFSFIIFPKLLNRLASATNERISYLLNEVRDAYISTSHLLVHFAILCFPVFLMLFPQYSQSSKAFKLIALTVVLTTNSFGYSDLLIAKGKEKLLGHLSFFALCINICLSFFVCRILKVPYSYVIFSTMITYLVYVFLLGLWGRRRLKLSTRFLSILKDVFPFGMLLPYLLSMGMIIFSLNDIWFILPLLLFIVLNYRLKDKVKYLAEKIFDNPDKVINI
ncbi:MAG: oligosaccharide flippase family protein [Prolixibacteraceae bacterium]|nr:oligosaccharide flippase family protein [Prolixibacteraceae bacterium]